MAEVLVRFTESVRDANGSASYRGQACGALASDGLWDGWIEFTGPNGTAIRSPRETKQPNRDALVYWAEGLSAAYLEGALRRALDTLASPAPPIAAAEPSIFSGPASAERSSSVYPGLHPVLDPFATYAQGENILRQQLSALSRDHLQALIDGYDLPVVDRAHSGTARDTVEQIVQAVRQRVTSA